VSVFCFDNARVPTMPEVKAAARDHQPGWTRSSRSGLSTRLARAGMTPVAFMTPRRHDREERGDEEAEEGDSEARSARRGCPPTKPKATSASGASAGATIMAPIRIGTEFERRATKTVGGT
jgi:hypothetical protein